MFAGAASQVMSVLARAGNSKTRRTIDVATVLHRVSDGLIHVFGGNVHGSDAKDAHRTNLLYVAHSKFQHGRNRQDKQDQVCKYVGCGGRDVQNRNIDAVSLGNSDVEGFARWAAVNKQHGSNHRCVDANDANASPDGDPERLLRRDVEIEGQERKLCEAIAQHKNPTSGIGKLFRGTVSRIVLERRSYVCT